MADYSNRNTYLKMMLGDGSVSNTSVPNIKDYIGNIGLNDEDIADALIMNNQRTSQELVNSISATSNQNNASTTSAPTTSLPKIEEKGWWENLVDGASALWAGFWDGLFNFADDVGDFFISVGDWIMGGNNSWADDAINYDWQAQATNSLNFISPLLHGGDIAQNYNEWGQSITQGGDTARQYLNEQKQGSWVDNGIGNFLIDAVNSIGYMLPSIVVGFVGGPAAGLATMGIGAGMGQTADAYQESNNMATALLSGIVAGGIEAGTEALGGFIPGAKTIGKTTLKAIGRQMLEEGVEEAVSGIFQPLVDSIAKWSADPFFSEDGTFVYLTPEFWVTGEDSVARQAALGAFTGGIFAVGNVATNRIKYGKTGQNFGKAYQEFVETRNEAVDLERKHKSLDGISEKLGQASVNLAEQTKALKTAIENGDVSKRQLKNIAKDIFGNKTLAKSKNLNTEVANVLNDSLNVFNGTPNVKTEILSSVIADINRSTGSSFKMDVQENLTDESGNKVNAYFNPNTNTILFDTNAIDNQGYQLLGHEVFGHGILESFNTNPKFKDIIYKEIQNDTDFVNKYKNKILQEYQTTENSDLYKSELISYYIQENVIENNDINKLELLANNRGFIRELFNNLKLILSNTTSNRVIREVRKAVRNFAKNNYRLNSIILKLANNKPFNNREQEYYNDNKTLIDTYFDIVNGDLVSENNGEIQVAYSKDLDSVVDELIEKSNTIRTKIESDEQGQYVVYQNLKLENYDKNNKIKIIGDYLKKKFSGVTFEIDGDEVNLTNKGIKKLKQNTSFDSPYARIELENLTKIAKFTEERPSDKVNENYNYRYYKTRLKIDDNVVDFFFNVKVTPNGYSLYDITNEIRKGSRTNYLPQGQFVSNASSSINPNISQNEEDFNNKDKKYSKQLEINSEMEENRGYERTNEFRELQEESRRLLKEFESGEQTYRQLDESIRQRYIRCIQQALESGRNSNSYDFRLLKSNKNSEFNITNNIQPSLFHDAFETIKPYLAQNELVDLHDNYDNCKCFLSEDGLQGFAIEENGNLISVFNADTNKRGFVSAIADYVKENGATHLDCYGYLSNYYNKVLGFKTASIMDYNMEYDHHNIAKHFNSPQVAFMVNTNEEVLTKHFNKDQYDEAQEYQLSFVNKNDTYNIKNTSPLKDLLSDKDVELYTRAKNGEVLTEEEILNSDIVKKLTNQNSNTNGYLISKEQSKGNEPISNELLTRFNNIKEEFENKYKFNETPADGIAVIVLGLPASGKSSTVVNKLDIMKNGRFFNLDNDNIKPLFKEFDNGKGAGYVHEASAYISEQMVLKDIVKNKKNVVVPVIGKGMGTLEMYGKTFHDAGYNRIEIINVKLPLDKSANRNFTRMIETGRNVNFEYLYSVGEKPNINYDIIKERIKNGKELYYTHYGAISTDVSFGESPKSIEDSGTLSLSSMDEERHQSNGEILGRSKMGRYENNNRRNVNSGLSIYSERISLRNSTKLENYNSDVNIQFLENNKANKVKENANRQLWQKVLNLKDAKNSYNSLINYINDKLNIDLDVSNKQDKIRALFDSYNVNEINNTLSDFAKDLLNSKVYKGVDTSLRELFESNGLDSSILENDIRKALKGVLDSKSKTSDTTKLFNKLQASLLKANDLIETYKNRARQFASLYKKVENIKKKLKIENNNTKLSDIKLDEVNLLKYLVSGRVFTNQGGISGTWRTRFYNLMQEDNSYFGALRNSVFNEYGELDKAIETFEYLGNSYDARRTTQLTLNLEEADALIQAFNSVLNAIKEYQNNYYSKVEELSRNVYNEQIGIIEANRNQSSFLNKLNTAVSRVSSPLSNLALYFGGENTRAYKSLIENIENKYGDYLYDVSDLQNSLQEKLEAISKKGILANQSKSVKSFRGINKLNKWHLYSMWLNLNAPSNLARVSEKGFTFKDKVGQTHHIYYDENLLSDIETYLDGVEIQQLQTLLDFYNVEVKEYIKKAQIKIDGFSNVLSNTYYPQITSKSELKGNLTGDEPLFLRDNGQFKNLKARTGVVTSLDLVNPLSLFREYIDSASRYSNLTQAERLLNRTLNKNVEIDGEKTSIRKLFKERYGNEFEKHLTSFFNKLTGNNNLISNSVISKIGGKSATAMLWFNFSTVMKQLGSLPMTANITGFSNVLRSLKNAFYVGKLHKQLYENNGYYRNRIEENGIIYANTMNSNVLQQASNIRRKIVSSGLKAMSLMDQYVVLLSYKASQENVYRLHNKDVNYKPGTELNIKEASLMMNKILLQTQSNAYAISTSMLRSGEMGDLLRYTFGVFGSDNQNKISELYQQVGTAIKQRNYLKYLQDKLNNSNITPEEKANIEKEIENSKSMYKTAVKRLLVRSIPNLAVSAVITTLVGVMMKYLLGRDKDEEWENFTLDFVGDAFVDWIPFIGTIYNAFQYDDGNFTPVPFAQIINLCEVIFNSFNKLSSGNLTQKEMTSMAFAIFNALSMLGGISPKNISNLIIGIADKFDPTTALKMQSLLYGYSQSYYTRLMKNALERKDYKNYKVYYKTNAELFKVNELSDKVLDKIISLKKLNYDVTMRNVPTSYNDENGISLELTSKQVSDFKEIYSLANKAAESVLNQTRFVKLTSEEQATVLRKIFDAYYDYAKAEVLGLDLVSRASKIIDMTDGQINIAKYIAYAQDLSDITGSDRKQQIETKLKVYYLSEFEKEMVLYLSGYEI